MSINFLTFYLAVGAGARSGTGHRAKLLKCSRACPQILHPESPTFAPPRPFSSRGVSHLAQVGLIAFNLFTTVILETFERIQDTEAWKITPANLDVSRLLTSGW